MKPAVISRPILLIVHFFMTRLRKLVAAPSFYQYNGKLFVKNGRRVIIGGKMTPQQSLPGFEAVAASAPPTSSQLMDTGTSGVVYKQGYRLQYSS
jgi:hypothetical protein